MFPGFIEIFTRNTIAAGYGQYLVGMYTTEDATSVQRTQRFERNYDFKIVDLGFSYQYHSCGYVRSGKLIYL